ncbi:MAG: hypothetical protein AAFU73_21560 [Planctomycetota bacterium]
MTSGDSSASAPASAQAADARGRRGLVGVAGIAALSQALLQTQAFTHNPGVLMPGSDGKVIWERAAAIAAGDLVGDAPFETAPLPLWLASACRAVGLGLPGFGAVQSALYVVAAVLVVLSTEALVARVADVSARAARGAGLFAAGLFVLNEDAAAATCRVLSGPLQLCLGAAWLLLALRGAGSRARAAQLGAVTGLLCLSFPPALGLVPVALFVARGSLANASVVLAAAALAVAPATLHNVAASGEPILISSQAGLTFYHGNNASADGVIAPVGVVNAKEAQALDSLERAREALGPDAGWADASAYWRGRGLEWWADEPGRATRVAGRKLRYALSGRNYGDVYQPRLERADGTASRLWLAPVPAAWLTFPALFAGVALLFGCRRRLARALPTLALGALPVLVCVVFFYTPRYRLPALPALCALTSLLVLRARTGDGRSAPLLGVAAVLGLVSGALNRATGFDVDPGGAYANLYGERMAQASGALGWHDRGARYLEALLEERPGDVALRERIASLHWLLRDDAAEALRVIDAAPPDVAHSTPLVVARATLLATANDAAVADGDAAAAITENLVAAFPVDGSVLELHASALARAGRFDAALEALDAALATLPPARDPASGPGEEALRADWTAVRALYTRGAPKIRSPRP